MENLYIFVLAIGFVAKFWQLFVFPFKYVGLGIFIIRDKSDVVIVSKKIFDNCQMKNGDKLAGFFINFSYIGYVKEIREHGNIENEIYILCTKSKYDELCKNPNQNNSEKNKSCDITYYFRSGNFYNFHYRKRNISMKKISGTKIQNNVIEKMKEMYELSHNNTIVCYIHGVTSSGKSTLALLLAKELSGSICKTFNPTDPGDNLELLYNCVSPTKNNPLIVVMEEIDGIIMKLTEGIKQHKTIPINIKNKSDWNTFFDDLKILYPYVIFLMTSNVPIDKINEIDPSYLRPGRIDCDFVLDEKICF